MSAEEVDNEGAPALWHSLTYSPLTLSGTQPFDNKGAPALSHLNAESNPDPNLNPDVLVIGSFDGTLGGLMMGGYVAGKVLLTPNQTLILIGTLPLTLILNPNPSPKRNTNHFITLILIYWTHCTGKVLL